MGALKLEQPAVSGANSRRHGEKNNDDRFHAVIIGAELPGFERCGPVEVRTLRLSTYQFSRLGQPTAGLGSNAESRGHDPHT